ncbi:MAG: 7,8-didemethyl-8-hydroxy-5-deazariboflavin synthase subunit CofG [Cenarchaeum symbiont of Oopsacas minuta]|nr:7,8-didemethyl-8-hydroxy-5-deazariboflavin synthase subunit CofG [Cenarchaeum symbiont of Oopsacas minuta]
MSEIVLHSDVLNAAIDGKSPHFEQALYAMEDSRHDPSELFAVSSNIRNTYKGNLVTFSNKVFINMTNLCRDTCTYCTYKREPDSTPAFMEPKMVRHMMRLGKKYGCTEALLVAGERPEEKYNVARRWLKDNGFSNTPDYAAFCSQIALEEGLYAHTNVGNLEYKEMLALKDTNPSIGLMLENSSPRLAEKNMPHHLAQSKNPNVRIDVIKNAGRAKIPTTTGILVGIGESEEETTRSLEVIRTLHKQYGHIQEVIVQNFVPKPQTIMGDNPAPDNTYFARTVALARIMMPEMNIQIPPNLSPDIFGDFLRVGVNDWGGISPVTPDYVNPEMPWPSIEKVKKITADAGFILKCRFATYPEFLKMIPEVLRVKIYAMADECGHVRR